MHTIYPSLAARPNVSSDGSSQSYQTNNAWAQDTYKGIAGFSDRSEKVVRFLLMSETRSTKYNQFTTSMKRQKMTRNQPDQRKGSMEGNWATTAAIPDGRRGHSAEGQVTVQV